MTRVCHLLDRSAGWEQRIGLTQLLDRLPAHGYTAIPATLDPAVPGRLALTDCSTALCQSPSGFAARTAPTAVKVLLDALRVPAASRWLTERRIDLIHAWGVEAAWAARAADKPLLVELFDPLVAVREIRRLRALSRPKGFAMACSCDVVRRRLVEGGLEPDRCVVIRPGVDFSLVGACRQGPLREQLGLTREEFVVLVPEPVARAGGSNDAFWAVAWISQSVGGVRLILPGASAQKRRIMRQATTLPGTSPLVDAATTIPFERLVAVSDALVVAPRGDLSTTSIAWAFAAGTAVIAAAVYAVAELVSHKLNGLLFKPSPDKSMSSSIVRALRDRASQERAREVARGHAYEAFGVGRCVRQHLRLYENLLSGAAPGAGITDSARTA